jgi:hypothetical protein
VLSHLPGVANIFSAARNATLGDADLDKYITAPLIGPDRVLAHKLMAFMPASQRGDFLYMSPDGRVISNNAALLPYAKVTWTKRISPQSSAPAAKERPQFARGYDYSSPCSPTNPYAGTGPYVRNVSMCGFGAGWAFLKIPCGTTTLNQGDNGYVYFEITGPSNSAHVEGGMFTPDGTTFDPYLRSDAYSQNNGYETLTNGQARYSCDEQMAIWHGITYTVPGYTFTEIGDASAYDPYTVWVNQQIVSLTSAAWLFGALPPSIASAQQGQDNAGAKSPCLSCSISQVTAIAQSNTSGWTADGSEFGIDASGNNAVQWLQVGFGNWDSNCAPGTTLCTFLVSADPLQYYGGPQYYPDSNVSGSNMGATGYGPYESVDGIQAYGGLSHTRSADIAINEPLPPPPCTVDSHGYCSTGGNSQVVTTIECLISQNPPKHARMPTEIQSTYTIYFGKDFKEHATKTTTYRLATCPVPSNPVTTWSPAEPRLQYNDSSLP